jgi:hypothetical protein
MLKRCSSINVSGRFCQAFEWERVQDTMAEEAKKVVILPHPLRRELTGPGHNTPMISHSYTYGSHFRVEGAGRLCSGELHTCIQFSCTI